MSKIFETNEIIVESLKICKKSKFSFFAPLLSLIFGFLMYYLAILSYIKMFQSEISLLGLSILVLLFTMYFRALFSTFHCYIIANNLWEEKPDFIKGLKKIFVNSGKMIFFSIIILIVGLISQSLNRNKKNIFTNMIKNHFEGIPEDMWDSVTHLSLPTMVLLNKNFGDSLDTVRKSLKSIPEIKIKHPGIEYFTYPVIFLGLIISVILSYVYYLAIGYLFFIALIIIVFTLQSIIKTTYYTELYLWLGEQVNHKKKKKKLETRVPIILENTVRIIK